MISFCYLPVFVLFVCCALFLELFRLQSFCQCVSIVCFWPVCFVCNVFPFVLFTEVLPLFVFVQLSICVLLCLLFFVCLFACVCCCCLFDLLFVA